MKGVHIVVDFCFVCLQSTQGSINILPSSQRHFVRQIMSSTLYHSEHESIWKSTYIDELLKSDSPEPFLPRCNTLHMYDAGKP